MFKIISRKELTRKLLLITQGISDTEQTNKEEQSEIQKRIVITSPALHAFVQVLNVAARYQYEQECKKNNKKQCEKYIVVLFSRNDVVNAHKMTVILMDHIKQSPTSIQMLVQTLLQWGNSN